jgi:hypothetical protein
MSDDEDWDFAGADDAKMTIRAAVRYLIKGATGGARGDIVQAIMSIVRQVASGLPPEQPNSLDLPGILPGAIAGMRSIHRHANHA